MSESMMVSITKHPEKPVLRYVLIQELEMHNLTKWMANLFASLLTFTLGILSSNAFLPVLNVQLLWFAMVFSLVFFILFCYCAMKNYNITKGWFEDSKRKIHLVNKPD